MFERLHGIVVTDAEITSEAEIAYNHGDDAASFAAARAAKG